MKWFNQLLCGWKGHDLILHTEDKKLMMRCTSCGHRTHGWEQDHKPPKKRFDGDPTRHQLKSQGEQCQQRRSVTITAGR